MNWRQIWTLYRRELRAALRERSIVVNSMLLPVFLYPVILWLTFTGMTFVQGLAEGYTSRVAVYGDSVAGKQLMDSLRVMEGVRVVDSLPTLDDARRALRAEQLDAALEVLPPPPGARALSGDFRARISFDGSETRSRRAREKLEGLIQRHRDRWIEARGRELGLSAAELTPFRISGRDVSTGRETGAFILSEMVPVFLVVMVALGCLVPAVDSTAGERERGTWETLMTVAAPRSTVVAAKYLYVVTLGTAAGVLNILAMTASVGAILGPLLGTRSLSVEYPPGAILVMLVGALVLALFFAAAMMILGSFARTFREGQSMVIPVYWLALIPLFLGRAPGQHLDTRLALVPVVNVSLMIRDAIQGVFAWPAIALSVGVGAAVVALCIRLAAWILSFEDVLMGSYDGSFWRFVRERTGR